MTIELKPLGVTCNLKCTYCYQNPQREAGNISSKYDMNKMKSAIEKEGGPFSLFGGEPLLVPIKDLEELWSWGFEKWGRNGIQTNGTLINQEHIRLFKKYNVKIGISIDGPGDLNSLRVAGNAERTSELTKASEHAIDLLCKTGLNPSLIITLHRINASHDKLSQLVEWIKHLDVLGIKYVRLHLLEAENEYIRTSYSLTEEENINALLTFIELEKDLKHIKFDMFENMSKLLIGDDGKISCVWGACDPYTTHAVQGIEGNGQRSNCGRTNKDGIDYVKSDIAGYERYISLYYTPQEYGGCKGCRFFLMCKGQCPGTAIDGDWRNRTEHCMIWKRLYEYFENILIRDGKKPLSLDDFNRTKIEKSFIESWSMGKNTTMKKNDNLIQSIPFSKKH